MSFRLRERNKLIKQFYSKSLFTFFQHQIKPKELEQVFIDSIKKEEEKEDPKQAKTKIVLSSIKSKKFNFSNIKNKTPYYLNNIDSSTEKQMKKIDLNLLFPKKSLEKIQKIRNLFLEFDGDKSRSFDYLEFYQMFNLNKIPITYGEIKYLFGFNRRKKAVNFSELVKLNLDPNFLHRFNEVVKKIRPRCEKGDICPNDFSEMLTHLCEFGKLSNEIKSFKRNTFESKTKINRMMNKTFDTYKINNNNIYDEKSIKYELKDNDINENKNKNFYITKDEYKQAIEISNKKLVRSENVLNEINFIEKSRNKSIKLSKSLETLYSLNPNIKKNYIKFLPFDGVFMDAKNNTLINFPKKKPKRNKHENSEEKNNINKLNSERQKSVKDREKYGNLKTIYYDINEYNFINKVLMKRKMKQLKKKKLYLKAFCKTDRNVFSNENNRLKNKTQSIFLKNIQLKLMNNFSETK